VLTLSTMLSSRIARKVSATRIITTGFSVQIVGFVALSQITTESSFWLLNGALMLVGMGSAMSVPSITNSMLSSITQHDAGIASGLMASARQLGGVIGVAVFGTLIAHSDRASFSAGMSNAMLLSALALLLCIAVNLYVARQIR
jgi:DHA2 family methylenomycin A resistance protein-like MFS transporter